MPRIYTNLTHKPAWMLSAVLLLMPLGFASCSMAGDRVLPRTLQDRVSSGTVSADDHIAAAHIYALEAQRLNAKAATYAAEADAITPLEDPKGFRRRALRTAAQEQQTEAGEMRQLYVAHEAQAQTMLGKQQPQ